MQLSLAESVRSWRALWQSIQDLLCGLINKKKSDHEILEIITIIIITILLSATTLF